MNTSLLKFLQDLLKLNGPRYRVTEINNQLFVDHSGFQQMIDRFAKGETSILPFQSKNDIYWMCLQSDKQSLTIDYASLKKFILPYCVGVSDPKKFFKDTSEFGRLGSELFVNGYYVFKSDLDKEEKVWDSLNLWLSVLKRKPSIRWEESVINAYTLRSKFRSYLEMMEWGPAERTLDVIREGHYVSDENYLFLYVELLVAQKKWKEIWYWTEFDALSGLHRIPKDVKIALLSAFYFVILAESDVSGEFQTSYEKFKTNRFRLSSLLDTHLGIQEEHIFRVFAYESLVENNYEKLSFIKGQAVDETTQELISYLESKFMWKEDPVIPAPPEKQAADFLQNGLLDDAYLLIRECSNSKEKVRIMSAIGFFTGSNEIQRDAYELLLALSESEQSELTADIQANAYLTFIKMANEGTRNEPKEVQEKIEYTWNHWFQQIVEIDENSLDPLFELLYAQDKLPTFIWSPSMISELGNLIIEIAITSFTHKKTLVLGEGITTYLSELIRDEQFPRTMGTELYSYSVEVLLLHCKKNEINTNYLNRLLEGLLLIDVQQVSKYWDWARQWYDMTPMKVMLPNLLFTLELFYDYGQTLDDLKEIWNQWTSTLLSGLSTLTDIEIRDWLRIGEALSGEEYLINSVKEFVTENEDEEDPLSLVPETTIVIFSLRESSARRAVEQITSRNQNLKVIVNADTSLTKQAKSLASNSDVVVLVTTAMKHALFYGITPYLKDPPLYPKSSGTSSIIAELEQHFA
ncbi:protein DpdD [Ectobacillus funiculus]|uniref:protein DpdD n=1 Tax=Ectobacillus funiculus TaxID=137993 RepID=UPI00101BC0EE|nr:protein DpdD [Ectobacillus funiculus]